MKSFLFLYSNSLSSGSYRTHRFSLEEAWYTSKVIFQYAWISASSPKQLTFSHLLRLFLLLPFLHRLVQILHFMDHSQLGYVSRWNQLVELLALCMSLGSAHVLWSTYLCTSWFSFLPIRVLCIQTYFRLWMSQSLAWNTPLIGLVWLLLLPSLPLFHRWLPSCLSLGSVSSSWHMVQTEAAASVEH